MVYKRINLLASMTSLIFAGLALTGFAGRLDNPACAERVATENEITFSRDVAPIFFQKCVQCHRPGSAAPMSLLSYRDARPWARSIRERVLNKTMPPWHADPAFGKFLNDQSLRTLKQSYNGLMVGL